MSNNTELLDEATFNAALPSSKLKVSRDTVEHINSILVHSDIAEEYKENLISYTSVLATGKVRMTDYVDAVRFVTYKMLGDTNTRAFAKTFPYRYQDWIKRKFEPREMSSRAAAFNRTRLVTKIIEQSLVPVHILNAGTYQKAINVQAELMMTANSEKVRSDAANSLLTHLKAPESQKIELDINVRQDKSIDDLRKTTLELVEQQKKMLTSGVANPQQIAHSKLIIEGEAELVQD